MGWKYGNQTITELETGTYGDIVLVAVWDKEKVNAIIFKSFFHPQLNLKYDIR